jgi:lysophospholipid acyltransferase (LPLAT)-like uncharacterized protein
VKYVNRLLGWPGGLLVLVWRLTCRYRVFDDPRPAIRASGRAYIYALLHAHQLAGVFVNDDHRMAAMLSRSADGDLLAPSLMLRRITPVRGSSRSGSRDKGGRKALHELMGHVRRGVPALIAVDGPRGPRNHVHRGVAELALETGVPVLPVIVLPSRRWLLTRAWDRFQIPKPFCTIRLIFGPPIEPSAFEQAPDLLEKISRALNELERLHDPAEAQPRD